MLQQLLLGLGAILGSFSLVFGQGIDTEPNNTCQEAQDAEPQFAHRRLSAKARIPRLTLWGQAFSSASPRGLVGSGLFLRKRPVNNYDS